MVIRKNVFISNQSQTCTSTTTSFVPSSSSSSKPKLLFLSLVLILVVYSNNIPFAESLNFSFQNFKDNSNWIILCNDSYVSDGSIRLTKYERGTSPEDSTGRASYFEPVPLWEWNTNGNGNKVVTSFTTHFQFTIQIDDESTLNPAGDGLTFFMAPFEPSESTPPHSGGGSLGLGGFANSSGYANITYPFVAVEFDTFKNPWDPVLNHVGINVNSLASRAYISFNNTLTTNQTANAWITYNSSTQNLCVFLTHEKDPVFTGSCSVSYIIDLASVLLDNESVRVGFSASTGLSVEKHEIHSWKFSSTLSKSSSIVLPPAPALAPAPAPALALAPAADQISTFTDNTKSNVGWVVGIVAAVTVLILGPGSLCFMWWKKRRSRNQQLNNNDIDFGVDDDFEDETGPRKFAFSELSRATNNFAEEGKLGEGGFGDVYKGLLTNPSREIAVKKISSGSRQGKKEYVSEVKIISRLRHRNLVQLLGWCHDQRTLLLVYEFMPNGSLDSHLYQGKKDSLPWTVRYKIAHGLASALLYLHEECEQCVLHRDIKSSNVMLDTNFNAILGDFGLARLVDHELGSQTTVLAGTIGYLAPECATEGKASKESDVYSFGIVCLEIACGRRPIEPTEEPDKLKMVEWVWDLYGKGRILEAADRRLGEEFEGPQMECLMVVALWCCHPDYTLRPSVKQMLNIFNLEAPLPNLPSKFPTPFYLTPMHMNAIPFTSSAEVAGSSGTTSSSSKSAI